jgi:hypothetical protein
MSLDLLFGSPQVWPPTVPAIGYNQPAISPGRALGPLMPPSALAPHAYNAGVQAAMGSVVNPVSLNEPAGVVTAAALLAAVAVRRGQPLGPTSDQEIEDFISDALDLLPGSSDIEVRCEGGRVALTGQVSHKRLKRDAGEIAWAIPSVNDVQNNVTIVLRRRSRPIREAETPVGAGRKQA